MTSRLLQQKAELLLELYRKKRLKITTAESCTGGMIAMLLTDIAGSSDVFERGFVTYSNASKTELLGVDAKLVAKYGAVSAEVAGAMARGALAHSRADAAVAVTGIAGPGGGTKAKPVGLVYIAVAHKRGNLSVVENRFSGSRHGIRSKSAAKALAMLKSLSF